MTASRAEREGQRHVPSRIADLLGQIAAAFQPE